MKVYKQGSDMVRLLPFKVYPRSWGEIGLEEGYNEGRKIREEADKTGKGRQGQWKGGKRHQSPKGRGSGCQRNVILRESVH